MFHMKIFPNLVLCEHCDCVYRRQWLAPGQAARCRQCDAVLYRGSRLDLDRWLALTAAAAIVFAIAQTCPVIRISLQGLRSQATIWQSAAALAHGPAAPVAVPAALAVILVPFLQIGLLGWILAHARTGRRAPGFAAALRVLVAIRPWSMIEVALLGMLVALVKLAGFVQVAPGAGIWATAVLMVLLALIASCDVQRLWDLAERVAPGQGGRA
jgi:paraquat-inducible protein A